MQRITMEVDLLQKMQANQNKYEHHFSSMDVDDILNVNIIRICLHSNFSVKDINRMASEDKTNRGNGFRTKYYAQNLEKIRFDRRFPSLRYIICIF